MPELHFCRLGEDGHLIKQDAQIMSIIIDIRVTVLAKLSVGCLDVALTNVIINLCTRSESWLDARVT